MKSNTKAILLVCLFLAGVFGLTQLLAPRGKKEDYLNREAPLEIAEKLKSDVKKNMEASIQGDLDTIVGFTHPRIIELSGGEKRARIELSKMLAEMKTKGFNIESFEIPVSPTISQQRGTQYAIVSTLTKLTLKGQKMENLNFQLGIKKVSDKEWVYIDSSKIMQKEVLELFPEIPNALEFPQVYKKKIQ